MPVSVVRPLYGGIYVRRRVSLRPMLLKIQTPIGYYSEGKSFIMIVYEGCYEVAPASFSLEW